MSTRSQCGLFIGKSTNALNVLACFPRGTDIIPRCVITESGFDVFAFDLLTPVDNAVSEADGVALEAETFSLRSMDVRVQ